MVRVDDRLTSPGDTETRRLQKAVVLLVSIVGAVATAFNAVPLFGGGLDAMGWAYVASALFILAGAIALWTWPAAFVTITFLLLFDVLVFPGLVQVLSGGLTSGMLAIPWALFAPLGAALAIGAWAAWAHLGTFVVTLGVVTALEPFSQGIAPSIQTDILVRFNLGSLLSLGLMAGASALYLLRQEERFRQQADALLYAVLPASVASRLKSGEEQIADEFPGVTVLFADVVGFTQMSSEARPGTTVDYLNDLFTDFDVLAAEHGVEKIKTVGDAYMAAAGLPGTAEAHVAAVTKLALDLIPAAERRPMPSGEPTRLRVGVHTGEVVGGVVGRERYLYDLWGDVVNVASRMESTGLPGRVQVTQAVRDALEGSFRFEARGPVEVKGKGLLVTYLVLE